MVDKLAHLSPSRGALWVRRLRPNLFAARGTLVCALQLRSAVVVPALVAPFEFVSEDKRRDDSCSPER